MRVLRPGGHLSVSGIVLEGDLPPPIRTAAESEKFIRLSARMNFDHG
jgi:hypothetical protein